VTIETIREIAGEHARLTDPPVESQYRAAPHWPRVAAPTIDWIIMIWTVLHVSSIPVRNGLRSVATSIGLAPSRGLPSRSRSARN
jgi:hypothetical protein